MNTIVLVSSLVSGGLGGWIVYKKGYRFGLLDLPNRRSSHFRPIPKGGAVGILVAFLMGSIALGIPWIVWVPATAVSFFSLIGDAHELSFQSRLAVQAGAAAIFMILGRPWIPALGRQTSLLPLYIPLGILMICASANMYNFMDGIDGIAAISGVNAFLFLGVYGLMQARSDKIPIWALGIAAACLGFLPLNFPKARVFMGDVGSVLLGFSFPCFLLIFSRSALDGFVMASFLFPFFIDELNTFVARIRAREKLTHAHRRHIYQILVNQRGYSHSRVSICYGLVQIIVGIATYMMARRGLLPALIITLLCYGTAGLWAQSIRLRWEKAPI